MTSDDVEKCYSNDYVQSWLQTKQIQVRYRQQTFTDWKLGEEVLTFIMDAFDASNHLLEYSAQSLERFSNPNPFETSKQNMKTVSLSESNDGTQSQNGVTISLNPVMTKHFLTFYEVSNLITDFIIMGIVIYCILSCLVPSKTFLLNRIIEDTSIIQ